MKILLLHDHKILSVGKPEYVLTKENLKMAYEIDAEITYNEKTNSLPIVAINIANNGYG